MDTSETVACPFCGHMNELMIDAAFGSQCFTTDCEICCRPFEVRAECQGGEILAVDVRGD